MVLIAQNRFLKSDRPYPVDYLKIDPNQENIEQTLSDYQLQKKTYVKNLYKNCVMRIIVENRERNNRPKLGEVIDVYLSRKNETPEEKVDDLKKQFRDKLTKLYSHSTNEKDEDEAKDERYQLLIDSMTRIKSQLGAHQIALSTLVMRVNNLVERKKRREDAI